MYRAIHKRRGTTHVARQDPSQAGCDDKAASASLRALRIWLDIRCGAAPHICSLLVTTRSAEDLIRGSLDPSVTPEVGLIQFCTGRSHKLIHVPDHPTTTI